MATKNETIVSYTMAEVKAMKGATDWAAVAAQTEEEIGRHAAEDEAESGPFDWSKAIVASAPRKAAIHMRIDQSILDHFRKSGRGYQTRINDVLAAYVRHAERGG